MSKKVFKLFLFLLVVAIVASGCSFPKFKKSSAPAVTLTPTGEETPAAATTGNTNQLKKFNNYDELAKFLADNNSSGLAGRTYSSSNMAVRGEATLAAPRPSLSADMSATAGNAVSASDSGTPNNSLDYSATNNQVAGVDEADIIKTDGNYIYALVRNELSIIKATPASELSVVSKITFQSRPQDIFINGNFLAVFGDDTQIYSQTVYQSFRRQNPYVFFKVFDISNPASPQQVRDLNFEGSYYDARLIGDYVYFLTNTYSNYLAAEPLLPRVLDNGQVLPLKCEAAAKCFAPEVYYFDIPYDSYNFTNITAVNIKNNSEAINGQIYLLDNSQNLYVSQNNIYITYTQYLNEYDLEQQVKRELFYAKLSAADQDKIIKIEAAPDFVLNKNEKKAKVAQIIDYYLSSLSQAEQAAQQTEIDNSLKQKLAAKARDMEKTIIHKIGISGNQIAYRARGEVSGQILNQFSMDENDKYFRVATTRNQQWSRFSEEATESYSNVYVLDDNLQTVGSLENLATAEKIYAARFLGSRVYLVTFKQTDPLFVISLADPTKPAVLGAIKIPGFSNYLHPVDKDGVRLIGLGRAAEETAGGGVSVKGLKLSLFDFSDLAKPKELDSYLIGDASSDSIALNDHKAFLYAAEKNLLAIPAVLRTNGKLSFSGVMVFTIDNNLFKLKGQIDHSVGGHFTQADYWRGFGYYDNTAKRSLYIGDNLYTFSNKFLKVNDLAALGEVKSLELTSGGDDYIITPMPLSSGGGAESVPSGGIATPPDMPSAAAQEGMTAPAAPSVDMP